MIYRWLTAGQILFYATLTLVKLSLLAWYRGLLDRTPTRYTVICWSSVTFCLFVRPSFLLCLLSFTDTWQSFIGSSMTTIFVCNDHKAKYNEGQCAEPNEQERARFSLWFAYAVDVATDLAGT